MFTRNMHWSLFWARLIQYIRDHHISSILILFSHLSIKLDTKCLKRMHWNYVIGFSWFRIRTSGGHFGTRGWTYGFMRRARRFLCSWVTASFSRRILLYGSTKWPPLLCSGQSSWLQIRRPGFDSQHYQKKKSSRSGTGPTQSREYNWGATW
jgi:hypothetical protein